MADSKDLKKLRDELKLLIHSQGGQSQKLSFCQFCSLFCTGFLAYLGLLSVGLGHWNIYIGKEKCESSKDKQNMWC